MNTETDCSHRLPFGLKWAGRGCKHSTTENLPLQEFRAQRVYCADKCGQCLGLLCLDCGRVY